MERVRNDFWHWGEVVSNENLFYVSDVSVSDPGKLPPVCLDKLYTADNLDSIFQGCGRSYFYRSVQYYCEQYSIIFKEL